MHKFIPKEHQKAFVKIFDQLCQSRQPWQVWADFVTMFAIAISNSLDRDRAEPRERRYLELAAGYQPKEQQLITQLVTATVEALDAHQEQDFLGDLYMGLGMGNHWRGQFFTPDVSGRRRRADPQAGLDVHPGPCMRCRRHLNRCGQHPVQSRDQLPGARIVRRSGHRSRGGHDVLHPALPPGVPRICCSWKLVDQPADRAPPASGEPVGSGYLDYSGLFYNEMGYEAGVCCRKGRGAALRAPAPDDRWKRRSSTQ